MGLSMFLLLMAALQAYAGSVQAEAAVDEQNVQTEEKTITGHIQDVTGESLVGVSVVVKGTTIGTITDINGNFNLKVPADASILLVSFIGMQTQEITLVGNTKFDIRMQDMTEGLDEVIVVGYGTQKKGHLTAAVSQIDGDVLEDRAIANAAQGLQGAVTNLGITATTSGGEPGASLDINIRGIITADSDGDVGDAEPLVLVDGIEMDFDNVDPNDIATVSVLKDASAAAIYGSRAAAGVILVTTKSGKSSKGGGMKISYSSSFSLSQPTKWPDQASPIDFAYTINESSTNNGGSAYWDDTELQYIIDNMEDNGSSPTVWAKSNDASSWDFSNGGLGATGATNWTDVLFEDWSTRQKHNINFTGGTEEVNYYVSAGFYNEDGLMATATDTYKRYNLDVKLNAKPYDWMNFSILTKMVKGEEEFPWNYQYGRGKVFDFVSKIKPTLPVYDPLFNEPLVGGYWPLWNSQYQETTDNQIILAPRLVIEPIKNWNVNLEYNYKRNNNRDSYTVENYEYKNPDGTTAYTPGTDLTGVYENLYTNEYFSPNLYTTYSKEVGGHNFKILAGYQQEQWTYYNIYAEALSLVSDNIVSLSTTTGETDVSDDKYDLATQSYFTRFNYDYQGKYLFEFSYRRDGSSKFEDGSRWAGFPSFSAGYNVAKENFWPLKDVIQNFKLRGSYGTLGNQNVDDFLYLSTMTVKDGTWLFDDEYENYVTAPDLESSNLTWETVETTDFGVDISALKGKLSTTFDWYRTDINDMAAQSATLPSQLGTDAPLSNSAAMRTQGWELELSWKEKRGDFSYNARFVLSDYKRTVLKYPNDTKLLSDYFTGQTIGDIYGLEWAGWFADDDDVTNYEIDQSAIYGSWTAGDTKYVDQNGDGVIDIGSNTIDDKGDKVVIGNTTPRYQYGLTLACDWKGIDFSMFIQGVGKKDYYVGGSAYRGPAQGPFHSNVYDFNLDYWRDADSYLGANPNAYAPKPYLANPGKNNRNYLYSVDRYVADASYARLKSIQLGYSLSKELCQKLRLDRVRVHVTGENLLTVSDFPMYDPEAIKNGTGNGIAYPLSKTISFGINVSL
jgi:TonB-linked SusC/RagA family outer membrane protein